MRRPVISIFVSFMLLFLLADRVVAAKKIIFVASTVPFGEADKLIESRLREYGLQIEPHSQDEDQPVDISGADAIFISESCSSGSIASAYEGAEIPVICTEFYIIDDMGFAPDGTFTNEAHRVIVITDPEHPIAGGLEGEVEVTSEAVAGDELQASSGMAGDVHVVASLPNGDACIMCYEEGAEKMGGLTAPARRVFVSPHSNAIPLLTEDGWGLLERSFLWALDFSMPVEPGASITATWGYLKKYYCSATLIMMDL